MRAFIATFVFVSVLPLSASAETELGFHTGAEFGLLGTTDKPLTARYTLIGPLNLGIIAFGEQFRFIGKLSLPVQPLTLAATLELGFVPLGTRENGPVFAISFRAISDARVFNNVECTTYNCVPRYNAWGALFDLGLGYQLGFDWLVVRATVGYDFGYIAAWHDDRPREFNHGAVLGIAFDFLARADESRPRPDDSQAHR